MRKKLEEIIESYRDEIIGFGRDIFEHPELGFKEFRTSAKAVEFLEKYCMNVEKGISVTGFRCTIGSGNGPNIGLIAELDAIPAPGHRCASGDKGAAHSCAHSNQLAIMLGAMKCINESGMLEGTGVRVTLVGTPAEEFTDLEYRRDLLERGEILHMSGKQDMIRKGTFDEIDMVISCHTMGEYPGRKADVNSTLNGFLSKRITYIGKASHAGATPHKGINALNAASIGIMAMNAQRETFIEDDMIRVHGIITEGGQSVNSVPEIVVIEAYVRGRTIAAVEDANRKMNRAFEAGAHAVGAACRIEDIHGYLPFHQCRDLSEVVRRNISVFVGDDNVLVGQKSFASGDIGDLGSIMPAVQFGFSGFSGNIHGSDFEISDEEMAYIIPAKTVACTVYDLVAENGKLAKQILMDNQPAMSKDEYLQRWLGTE
ncbi:amidohydrolase [Youngiibacter fragilis]|uniref:Peptidase M20 domain-containing protein 2 n=1 Tax=Youngiibacter fragilis 232.1 TaxID=994573 RepID=V7I3E3_9CLOT|nr:amidohydrolase [Youngiibacter fragilis]ETA80765.1 peptidase M20 [Youngiibacter fragilis 232.1]